MQKIIFTDLDGTLLDRDSYSYEKAKGALRLVDERSVSLVICTSKTRAEIELYRKKLRNCSPFISENGGAIFIPKEYFDFELEYDKEERDYFIIELGTGYEKLIRALDDIRCRHNISGFHEMTGEEVAEKTGLSLDEAKLAKKRDYDEVFEIIGKAMEKEILDEIDKKGLNHTHGGRFYHIMGDNDKGRAVRVLTDLFRKKYGDIETIGIGDSENDFEMLNNVDKAYLVRKKDGKYSSDKYNKAEGIGPEGWNEVVKKELVQ